MKIGEWEIYESAALLPMLGEDALDELAENVRRNGLLEPIVLLDGKVLDGRNRLAACLRAGVKPRFRDYDGDRLPSEFVASMALLRRHLSVSQRTALAATLLDAVEAEAKERQVATRASAAIGGSRTKTSTISRPRQLADAKGEASAIVARATETKKRSVERAKAIKDKAPEKLAEVREGKKTLYAAEREIKAEAASSSEPDSATSDAYLPEWRLTKEAIESILKPLDAAVKAVQGSMKRIRAFEAQQIAAGRTPDPRDIGPALSSLLGIHDREHGTAAAPDLRQDSRILVDLIGQLRLLMPREVCPNCGGSRQCPGEACRGVQGGKCPCGSREAPRRCACCRGRGFLTERLDAKSYWRVAA